MISLDGFRLRQSCLLDQILAEEPDIRQIRQSGHGEHVPFKISKEPPHKGWEFFLYGHAFVYGFVLFEHDIVRLFTSVMQPYSLIYSLFSSQLIKPLFASSSFKYADKSNRLIVSYLRNHVNCLFA